MRSKIYMLLLLIVSAGAVKAQDFLGVNYSTGMSVGNLNDYVGKYSFRGMGLDFRTALTNNIVYGLSSSWNVFYEKRDYDSYTFESVTATGKQYRYTNAVPMMGNIDYTGKSGGLEWFAGLGIGTTYINRETDFGSWAFITNTWQFLLAPEVGVSYPLLSGNAFYASMRYNQNIKSKDLDGQSYLSINIGLGFGRLTNK